MSVLLKRNDKTSIPEHFIIYDTETYSKEIFHIKQTKKFREYKILNPDLTLINEHFLSFGYAFYYQLINGEYKKIDEIYFETSKTFTEYVLNHIKKGKTLYIFAHNISYDFRVSIDEKLIKDADFKLKIPISDKVFIYKYGKKNFDICFLSTTNYFRTSLKELGKTFNLAKLDFKFDDEGKKEVFEKTEKAKRYCYRDVEILEKACINLFNFTKDKCKFSYTISSICFNTFRHLYYDENIILHKNPLYENIERASYYGGLTMCFRIGKFNNITKLDINSMYASVMLDNDFPIELVKHIENGNKELLFKLINEKQYLIIAKVKVDINKIKIPFKDNENKKLLYPIGIFTTILCQPELELLSENEILEVYDILIYRKAKIFNKYVTDFYNLRMRYKSEKNEVMQYFCKNMLTNVHGKFAQKQKKEVKNTEYDNILYNGYLDYSLNGKVLKLKFVKGECFEVESTSSGYNTFISISAFITAYSRVKLINMINLVIDHLLYVDTDSLLVTEKGYKILKDNNYVDNKELGKLKNEGELKEINIKTLKDYSVKEIIIDDYYQFRNEYININFVSHIKREFKIKGIKKSSVKNAILNKENLELKETWNINRFLGYNESLRYFNLIVGDINETKILKRKYEKGIVINGIVKPFQLNESNII